MAFDGWVIANLVTIVIFFITVEYYKGKVDTILKDNETLHSEMDIYHRRLDTHGDDTVRLNTKAELAITAKEVDNNYVDDITEDEINLGTKAIREIRYRIEADPLFFKAQKGEIDELVWLEKVAEIKAIEFIRANKSLV